MPTANLESARPNFNDPLHPINPQATDATAKGSSMFPTGGQLNATAPMPADTPLQVNPINNSLATEGLTKATNQQTQAIQQGDQAIANSAKSGGGSSAGGILGTIGGIIGGIASIFFRQGGYVYPGVGSKELPGDKANGYATGGEVTNNNIGSSNEQDAAAHVKQDLNKALAVGYAVGALHQKDYGGSPDTLEQATKQVMQTLTAQNNPMSEQQAPGMAEGGPANSVGNDDAVQTAIMQALNMAPDNTNNSSAQPSIQQPSLAPAPQPDLLNTMQANMKAAPAQSTPAPNVPAVQNMGIPTGQPQVTRASGGYMDGMDLDTGPQEAQNNPQGFATGGTFEGEGEVKGPGGPTDDAIPAKLSNGEFVMSAAATQFFGVDKLAKMNDQGKQGFMQRMGEVDANQDPNAMQDAPMQPGQPPALSAMNMPVQQQAKGGISMNKHRGYMGI